jgi:hypothetical protein
VTTRTSASFPPTLAPRIVAGAGTFFGLEGDPTLGAVEASSHPYSLVFRVELRWPATSRRLYVKVPPAKPRNVAILAARLSAEYAILGELTRHFAGRRDIGVVEPYARFDEPLAVATVEAQGITLRRLLARSARVLRLPGRRARLERAVRQCGCWLREFQQATARGTAAFDHDALLSYCRLRVEELARPPAPALPGDLAQRILERLADRGEVSSDAAICGRHNDFAGHNIIVGEEGVRVLDFSMFDHGPAVFDVANFWLDLELLKPDPTYSPRVIGDLQRAFLESYGLADPRDPAIARALCRYVLNRLLTLRTARPRPLSLAERRLAAACHAWLVAFAKREGATIA